jgi:hypothetical protein
MATQKITVSFDVEIDVEDLNRLRSEFNKAKPGSAKREAIFDSVKSRHTGSIARLEGELLAHGNIARQKLKQLYEL